MLPLLALPVGLVLGFVGSRRLRRPAGGRRNAPRPGVATMARGAAPATPAPASRLVGGSRRTLTPGELQRACFLEMQRHVQADRQGRLHAPARWVVRLSLDDLAIVEENRTWFTEGLATALRDASAQNGWQLDTPVVIDYQADPSRRPGVPSVLAVSPTDPAAATPGPPPPAPAATAATGAPQVLVLVRDDLDEPVTLGPEPVTIGRSRDRTITIEDNRVSRSHATITPVGGGWTITDQGSSNGTRVGGVELAPHEPRPLRAGDVIGIGPVDLRVTARAGNPAEPGTRALDDRTRTRISAEVLPPAPEEDR